MEPKISIIVPVYNVEDFLERCVNSLINQSYKNIEIILVNDGSKDKSGELCNKFKNENKNIVVIHRKKSSGAAGKARNVGLKMATGFYISFIDSDDWIHPEMIKSMIKSLEDHQGKVAECDLAITNRYYLDSFKNINQNIIFIDKRIEALKRIIKSQRFSVCIRIYERELIKDLEFPENIMSEDVYFTLEILTKVDKIVRIDRVFYYYYMTTNSVTRNPYSLKKLDTLNSGLHLQKIIKEREKDPALLSILQDHILHKLLFHYKLLNYNPHVDPEYLNRKRVKQLIDQNYYNNKNHSCYLKLANYLPIKPFEVLIKMNKLKHKLLKTNKFS